MRTRLFWICLVIFLCCIWAMIVGDFLIMQPRLISEESEDLLRYWSLRIAIPSGIIVLLCDLWDRRRP